MNSKFIILLISLLSVGAAQSINAQTDNTPVRKGNQFFKQGKYDQAQQEYEKAITTQPDNPTALFNLGNTWFRKNDFAAAEKQYDESIAASKEPSFKQKGLYNKGVTLSKQKKLLESIGAYKEAIKLDPADDDARTNLQKALEELKKQQTAGQKPQEQQQKQQKQDKPQPKQTNLDKKKIEQYLKSLQQKEQEVQQKIQQNRNRSASRQTKDW